MTSKQKNLITRSITGILFVAIMVTSFLQSFNMIVVFALITGLATWEFTGLVNEHKHVNVNRLITTVAGVYFFFAVAGVNSGAIQTSADCIPRVVTASTIGHTQCFRKCTLPYRCPRLTLSPLDKLQMG